MRWKINLSWAKQMNCNSQLKKNKYLGLMKIDDGNKPQWVIKGLLTGLKYASKRFQKEVYIPKL